MRTPLSRLLLAVPVGLFAMLSVAHAGAILTDTWYEFSFLSAGTPTHGCSPNDPAGLVCSPSSGTPTVFADAPAWTITTEDGAFIAVTDAFAYGDSFEILDGLPIFMTPFVATGGNCGDDPLDCLANPASSSATFALDAGNHSFTIAALATEFPGAAYFCVGSGPGSICQGGTTQMDAPATFALLSVALAGLCFSRRRKLH